jgi:hypothetical protein
VPCASGIPVRVDLVSAAAGLLCFGPLLLRLLGLLFREGSALRCLRRAAIGLLAELSRFAALVVELPLPGAATATMIPTRTIAATMIRTITQVSMVLLSLSTAWYALRARRPNDGCARGVIPKKRG